MEKRLKQERLSEGRRLGWSTERKMKWKLISLKNKVKCKRAAGSTGAEIGCDFEEHWKVSRFIASPGEGRGW